MGKKKQNRVSETKRDGIIRHSLGLVFNLSTLTAALSVLFQLAGGNEDLFRVLFRAMVVFVCVAVAGTLILLAVLTFYHQWKREHLEQQIQLAHEEHIASLLGVTSNGTEQAQLSQHTEHQSS